jgi:hypothetical protein
LLLMSIAVAAAPLPSTSKSLLGVVVPIPTWALTPPPQNTENQHVKFFHDKRLK